MKIVRGLSKKIVNKFSNLLRGYLRPNTETEIKCILCTQKK